MCGIRMSTVAIMSLSFVGLLGLASAGSSTLNFSQYSCDSSAAFAANGTYAANLVRLFSALSTKIGLTNSSGFANSSISGPTNSSGVHGMALCRGDVSRDVCSSCVSTAIGVLCGACYRKPEAVVWREWCTVRYADREIYSHMEDTPEIRMYNVNNITGDAWFQVLEDSMEDIIGEAAGGGGGQGKKFGMKAAIYTPLLTLYSMAQCTPDLTKADCIKCLQVAKGSLPVHSQGGIELMPSCNLRYELYRFSENFTVPDGLLQPPSPPSATNTSRNAYSGKRSGKESPIAVVAVVAGIAVAVLVLVCTTCLVRRHKSKNRKENTLLTVAARGVDFTTADPCQFDFTTLQYATQNFSATNKIGEGGFGTVYKGALEDGRQVAVKRLCTTSDQGDEEFKNEAILVARLQHRNLVRMLGFCLTGKERLLVYEYVPNHSLNYFLFDPRKPRQLDWPTRFKIIGGIARGMLYLHEDSRLRIIHRDLKASNILLDETMNPKIADFGMARIFGEDQTHEKTKKVAGTHGYMAPEYVTQGQYSIKSDVYSFGVLVLEIISGQKNSTFHQTGLAEDLLSYGWENWRTGNSSRFTDSTLNDDSSNSSSDEVKRCIQIGLLCVQKNGENRPTMATIVHMLGMSSFETLPNPDRPDFFVSRTKTEPEMVTGLDQSTTMSVPSSLNEASITEINPR